MWKLPKYRHASYADISRPELGYGEHGSKLQQRGDEDFADPPDPRYPGALEKPRARNNLGIDLGKCAPEGVLRAGLFCARARAHAASPCRRPRRLARAGSAAKVFSSDDGSAGRRS